MSAWLYALITIGATVIGIVLNYFIVSALTKRKLEEQTIRYTERVDRLTSEVNRWQDTVSEQGKEIAKLSRQLSALTGLANGTQFRKEGD
jgi:membrane protein YqaA with SNARE-associated domain